MKKSTSSFVLLLVMLAYGMNTFGQASTFKLRILSGWKGRSESPSNAYKIYVNDKLVTTSKVNEVVSLEVLSQGRLSISLVDARSTFHITVDITPGDSAFIVRNLSSIKVTELPWHLSTHEKWKELAAFSKETLEIEEDANNPWGKISQANKSSKGQGTGFLISPDGYVITNYHVIENAKEITVKGIDGDFTTKYGATLVASDPGNDLALIKLGNKNLKFETPPFSIRSNGVSTAEKVYALGFPRAEAMGEEIKVTEGIISSKSGAQGDVGKFQISAAVNPGNSGGPLIDEQGNLVGVIFAKSTVAESAGYAIKANNLLAFLNNIEGFALPNWTNSMSEKSVVEKVAKWKGYVFIVETN